MEEKKEDFFEVIQDRREFFKTLGKAALPAIAFLGLGTLGTKLNGSQNMNATKPGQPMTCDTGCSGGCEGNCKGDCSGSCKGDCGGTCAGDCDGSSKGDSSNISSKGLSNICRD